MRHVMLDLETLGLTAGCAILSLGAVPFSAEGGVDFRSDGGFYRVINLGSSMAAGLYSDPSTLDWWRSQAKEARDVFSLAQQSPRSLLDTLAEFTAWFRSTDPECSEHDEYPDCCVWGNGAEFDNAVVSYAYRAVKLERPWHHKASRCYRTLKELRPDIQPVDYGVPHNALDDAIAQALHAVELMRALGVD
jgi:hypothetical protein